jgi:hypothetical protein
MSAGEHERDRIARSVWSARVFRRFLLALVLTGLFWLEFETEK